MKRNLINAGIFLAVVAGIYAGCATAAAVTGYPLPISGALLLPLGWAFFVAIDGVNGIVAQARAWIRCRAARRRRARAVDGYQIGLSLAAAARRAGA